MTEIPKEGRSAEVTAALMKLGKQGPATEKQGFHTLGAETAPQSGFQRLDSRLAAPERPTPPILELARTLYDKPSFVERNESDVVYQTNGTSTAIVTSNLWVCTATVVEFTSRAQRGSALAHYDPGVTTISGEGLGEEFIEKLKGLAKQGVDARATVISPGTPSPLSPTGYVPEYSEGSRLVTARLREVFGKGLPVTSVGYSREDDRGAYGGSVLVGHSRIPRRTPRFLIGGRDVSGKI
jgi:hypothetical protein